MAESDEIKSQLDNIMDKINSFQETLAPLKKQQESIDAMTKQAYNDYLEKVAELKKTKSAIDEQMFEAQKAVNGIQQEASLLQAKYIEAKEREAAQKKAEDLQAEFAVMRKKWDLLTAGAHWREWAKDHQIQGGYKITEDQKVILADPMGLGKTLTSIISVDLIEAATKDASPDHPFLGEEKEIRQWTGTGYEYVTKIVGAVEKPCGRKIFYLCPASMIKNVEAEFRMWAKHRNVVWIGGMTKAERNFAIEFVLKGRPEYVVICNYEAWRKDKALIDSLVELEFDTVIIDEAHNIKDMKSIAYRGVKDLLDKMDPPYVLPMTGTPILNRPQELFSLLTLVNPGQFYALNSFLYEYCEQDENGFWKFQPGGLDRIAKRISKNFLRRTRDQAGIQLPSKTVTVHSLQVDAEAYPNQAKVRKQMKENAIIMLSEDKAISAAAMIAVFTRLRQIETWPAGIEIKDPLTKEVTMKVDVEESQKIDYVISWDNEAKEWNGLIPEIIEDERIVLFSQFKAPLREIKDRVQRLGKRAVILDGDTPADIKDEIRIDFDIRHTPDRSKSKWDIVLCNYRVGGVGLNLTAATQMIILDEEWNPGKRDQAYDRIHRIGQEKPVTIHVIRNENTIDDWLAAIIEAKESVVDGFNNTMVSASEFKDALESGLL